MKRSLVDIVEVIIKLVPDTFVKKEAMVEDLKRVQRSAVYTPPEYIHQRWDTLANHLTYYLGLPDEGWKFEIAMIFSDDIDYRKYTKEGKI